MRKLIIATAALAFVSSTALAQSTDKGASPPPASDSMSKGSDMSKDTMSKSKKKTKKSAKKTGDDTMTKQ